MAVVKARRRDAGKPLEKMADPRPEAYDPRRESVAADRH